MRGFDPKVTPWQVDAAEFPAKGGTEERLRFLVRYAILAPSTRNTQPWKFAVRGSEVHIHADHERWQPIADPKRRELYVSLGAALENLVVAGGRFGFWPGVHYLPNQDTPSLAAAVRFDEKPNAIVDVEDPGLFPSITDRHTNHKEYWPEPFPEAYLTDFCDLVGPDDSIRLDLKTAPGFRRRLDAIIAEADRVLFADPNFRHELGHWIAQGVFGTPWLVSLLGSWAISTLNAGGMAAGQDHQRLTGAPVVGLFSGERDDLATYLAVGQAFERVWLMATRLGVSVHPMSQALEVPQTCGQVAALFGARVPVQLFRMGFADPEQGHSPRRPLDEVLLP
jgi:nitroreductase